MTAPTSGPDKATRISLGCLVAFLSVFLLAGLFSAFAALAGRSPTPGPALGLGLVFIVVAVGGLLLVRWGWRELGMQEQRRRMAPDQPWAWKHDLSTRVVKGTSPAVAIAVWVGFAGVWLAMVAGITVAAWEKVREETGVGLFLAAFWAAGLLLAVMAVRALLHARRFGSSSMVLDATPARLGGWLSGVVRAPLALEGAETQLDVSCIETARSSHRSSNSSSSTWVRWRTTKLLDGTRFERQADHVEIPFAVRLPTNEDAARDQANAVSTFLREKAIDLANARMDWYVGVKARLPGVDYAERFAVPVAPAAGDAVPEPTAAPREMPELTGEQLAERLPARLEYRSDADVFVFPVKLSWIVWTLGLSAVAVMPFFADAPLLARVPPGVVKWGAIVCGVLAALSVISVMLETRSIEVAPAAVRIRRGLLGVGFHKTIPRSEIAKVEEESSRSDPPTYSVNIRLRNGKSHWAAFALSEPDQAAALATRLRQILEVG